MPRFSVNGTGGGSGQSPSIVQRHRKAIQVVAPILDQINQKFLEYEKRLKAFQPVKDVMLCYDSRPLDASRPDDYVQVTSCLALVMYKGEWRLCQGTALDPGPWPDDWQPITEAPRRVRVDVAARMPKLYQELREQIVKETEEFGPRAEKALAKMTAGLEVED